MADQFNIDEVKQVIEGGVAQAQDLLADPSQINDLLKQLEEKAKDLPSAAGEALGNIPLMAQMVKSYVTKEYTEVSPKVVATLVSAFLYLVKQKDLVSDSIPVLGLVDDVAVIAFVMKFNENELAAYKQWRDAQLPEAEAPAEA